MGDPADLAPEERPFPFMKLPPEMRDMVYDFAYGEERNVKIISRSTFEDLQDIQEQRVKRGYMRKTFPESYLRDMLVSKQFFEDAARIWISSKRFHLSPDEYSLGLRRMSPAEASLFSSITSLHIVSTFFDLRGIDKLPRLTRLELEIDDLTFECGSKTPWRDAYTDTEIAATSSIRDFLKLKGIAELSISWTPIYFTSDQEELDTFERFKAQVEKLFRDVVCQPRGSSASALPSFTEALKLGKSRKRSYVKAVKANNGMQALTDDQVPKNEDQLLRTVLLQPTAVLKWMEDAKKIKAEHAAARKAALS